MERVRQHHFLQGPQSAIERRVRGGARDGAFLVILDSHDGLVLVLQPQLLSVVSPGSMRSPLTMKWTREAP